MTTFDLEITQVQLKNHTKSHESKLRISNPEWYGIYVQMSGPQHRHCHHRRCPCVTRRCRRPHVTCRCRRRHTRVTIITHASLAAAIVVAYMLPSLPSLLLLLTGPCWGVTVVIIIIVIVVVIVVSAATVAMWGDSIVT